METKVKFLLVLFMVCLFSQVRANDTLTVNSQLDEQAMLKLYLAYADSVVQTMNYETGTVRLGGGVATIEVPKGFKYLNPEQSEIVLVNLWGNPPDGDKSLGMLFLEDESPMTDSSFAINITYMQEGYVDDADAADIDYDELEKQMKTDEVAINEQRKEAGYSPIHFVGWATPPHYSSAEKKLYWAKELKFGDDPENTLNYNIRILGRKGYLELNAIGQMYVLNKVAAAVKPVLDGVNFNKGYRYADFNSNLDKVAAYGIGGLIAGKVLLKAGLLAKAGVLLAKFWKAIVLAIAGLSAGVKKFFNRGE